MRDFGVVIFIVAAGFVAWLAVTNRLGLLGSAWQTVTGSTATDLTGVGIPLTPQVLVDRVLA